VRFRRKRLSEPIFARVGGDIEIFGNEPTTASFCPGYYRAQDGTVIAGLAYRTDYRAEEEWGIGDLRKAITSDNPRRFCMTRTASSHIVLFTDVTGLVFDTAKSGVPGTLRWGDPIGDPWYKSTQYADDFDLRCDGVQGKESLRWKKQKELREIARDLGVKPLPRTNDALRAAIRSHPGWVGSQPNCWPAWFSTGKQLVLRADRGLAQQILGYLIEAIETGTLGIGSGSGLFSTGLFFYDTRDETPEMIKIREAEFDWHDEQMRKLQPVMDELKRRGHDWFFLGKPRQGGWKRADQEENDEVRYWLNGCGSSLNSVVTKTAARSYPQPYGWYTLQELLDEKFIDDAIERKAERKS
jgi:hypothetical protein